MNESMHKYFKIGTIEWMSYPPARLGLIEGIKAIAKDDYFDAIEICHIKDDAQRAEARDLLAQSKLTVCYGAQPRLLGEKLNPNALDENERKAALNALIEAIDEAEYLGARGIAFLAGHWSPDKLEEHYEALLKTTGEACEYAAKKDMLVELEVFDYDMDKKSLIGPAPLAARFAEDVRKAHANFGLIVDLSHFPTTYETSEFVIKTLRSYITHLHFGNAVVKEGCEAYGDKHPCFGYPNGANDTPELMDFLRVLRDEGFFREDSPLVLSMEVAPTAEQDCDLILTNTKRALNRAWAML